MGANELNGAEPIVLGEEDYARPQLATYQTVKYVTSLNLLQNTHEAALAGTAVQLAMALDAAVAKGAASAAAAATSELRETLAELAGLLRSSVEDPFMKWSAELGAEA